MASPIQPPVPPRPPLPPLPPPHRRRSFAGPLVLIILGLVFLLGNMHLISWERLGTLFAHYWPLLLILWGVIKLIEYQQAQRDGVPARGIGAGGILLVIAIVVCGLTATGVTPHLGELREHLRGEEIALLGAERREEAADEQGKIVDAFTQRRHAKIHHREAEVEVFAEPTAIHFALEVAIGRRDNAHVNLMRARIADRFDFALLQDAQQFGLHLNRHLADFIEKNHAAGRRPEQPDLIG